MIKPTVGANLRSMVLLNYTSMLRTLLFILSLCLLGACNKGIHKTEKMLRGDWRMIEKFIDDGKDTTFKGNRVEPGSCLEDDVTTFKKNGDYILDVGESSCGESVPLKCDWHLLDERTIQFSISYKQNTTMSEITEISANTLTLTETRGTIKGVFVYERIN